MLNRETDHQARVRLDLILLASGIDTKRHENDAASGTLVITKPNKGLVVNQLVAQIF